MNGLFIITYKGKRVAAHYAETKWQAIDIGYNDAICRGFNAQREHFDAFRPRRKTKPKPKKPLQLSFFN